MRGSTYAAPSLTSVGAGVLSPHARSRRAPTATKTKPAEHECTAGLYRGRPRPSSVDRERIADGRHVAAATGRELPGVRRLDAASRDERRVERRLDLNAMDPTGVIDLQLQADRALHRVVL